MYVRELRFSLYLHSPSLEIKILYLCTLKGVGWFVRVALLEGYRALGAPCPLPHLPSRGAGSAAPGNTLWGILLPSELPPPQCSSCQEPGAAPAPVLGLFLLLVTDVRVWWGGQVYCESQKAGMGCRGWPIRNSRTWAPWRSLPGEAQPCPQPRHLLPSCPACSQLRQRGVPDQLEVLSAGVQRMKCRTGWAPMTLSRGSGVCVCVHTPMSTLDCSP